MAISKIKTSLIILGVLAFFGMLALYFFWNPSGTNIFPKCPVYSVTGIYCPGCGSQRATHQLLNFNFLGVFQQNILYVMGLFIVGYHLTISN